MARSEQNIIQSFLSLNFYAAGKQNGGGPSTLTAVWEVNTVPGTGSLVDPAVAACNIDGLTNGCQFKTVGVGTFRFDSSGDILAFEITGGTGCADFTTLRTAYT